MEPQPGECGSREESPPGRAEWAQPGGGSRLPFPCRSLAGEQGLEARLEMGRQERWCSQSCEAFCSFLLGRQGGEPGGPEQLCSAGLSLSGCAGFRSFAAARVILSRCRAQTTDTEPLLCSCVHGLSCPRACGVSVPSQELNRCPLYWNADSFLIYIFLMESRFLTTWTTKEALRAFLFKEGR